MTGHSAHDAAHYVPKELFDEWGKLDPIVRLEKRMIENGWADQAELDAVHAAVSRKWTKRSRGPSRAPTPIPPTLLDDVYEEQ